MVRRNIIKIDHSLCNGCGNCIIACSEGAIQIVDGKALVVSDAFCDGLGACIGVCPSGALTIELREAQVFDEKAAKSHMDKPKSCKIQLGTEMIGEEEKESGLITPHNINFHKTLGAGPKRHMSKLRSSSQLSSWPIKMRLVHADSPCFKEARLLVAADCSAFACPTISEFIKGNAVLIGCPKLDQANIFVEKLAEILRSNEIKKMTILHMEVPCCSNLVKMVLDAVKKSGRNISIEKSICMIDGVVVNEKNGSVKP